MEMLARTLPEQRLARALEKTPTAAIQELKRTLAKRIVSKKVFVQATPSGLNALKEERGEVITQLTPQMLKARAWEGKKFVPYDVPALFSVPLALGKKHAYKQLLLEIKQKLVGMGFVEAHGPLVEMEFWNMDALFMAQDHPARP